MGPPGVTPEELSQLRNNQNLLRSDIANLQRLMAEFSSELAMLAAHMANALYACVAQTILAKREGPVFDAVSI